MARRSDGGLARLIVLGIGLTVLDGFRERLGITWETFGLLAVLAALAAPVVWFALVRVNDFLTIPEAKSLAAPAPQAAPPPKADIAIAYTDSQGEETRREITVMEITGDRRGLLTDLVYIQAWCHLRQDERTFAIDRVRAVIPLDGSPARLDGRQAIVDLVRARPNLMCYRALPYGLPAADGDFDERLVRQVFDVLIVRGGESQETRVTVSALLISHSGLAVALRGRNHDTRRRATFHLRNLQRLVDAETGEIVEDDAPEWLREKAQFGPRNGPWATANHP